MDKAALEAAEAAFGKTCGGTMDGRPMQNAIEAYLTALRSQPEEAKPAGVSVKPEAPESVIRFIEAKHDWPPAWIAAALRGENDGYRNFLAALTSGEE